MATLASANCEIAFDKHTRQLYATDASIYQVEPVAVAFPKTAKQASDLVLAAGQAAVSVTPRGAGTGLAGGAIGDGLIIDFARHNRQISELDLERRTVRVGPGVVLDQLNDFLRPHSLCFGPDVATSSRATLGGMIANDSSGAYTRIYGTTSDHIESLEVLMADGRLWVVGGNSEALPKQRDLIRDIVYFHSLTIDEWMPPGLFKRRPGYALDRCAREPENLARLICGSEGTLAGIISAELRLLPLPEERGVGLLFFASVAEAMEASVELLKLEPAAVEHLDRVLLDQTKGQVEFQAARDLLELDARPCEAILTIEFFDHVQAKLSALEKLRLGLRTRILRSSAEIGRVWAMRKAGLSLLTGRKGAAKPLTGIEDTAVNPRDLPAYVSGLQELMGRLGLEASYYGHAAAGLLHVRPVLDPHSAEDLKKFRQVANEVSALVRQFKGSLAGEHGVGMARTEFMAEQVGEALLGTMREIKASFDPGNLFNPGKIVAGERVYKIDTRLRLGAGYDLKLPFTPMLGFAAKDGSFVGNLEQCNGCGGCLKQAPTMCPTYITTGREVMSTRGRANTIRATLEGKFKEPGQHLLDAPALAEALDNCLSCKACATECPSNVSLPLLKAELSHANIVRRGLSLRQRVISSVDLLGKLGCLMPRFANFVLDRFVTLRFLYSVLGLAWQRQMPHFAGQRFDKWFVRRAKPARKPWRGRVVLWDDTFVRYHEPHIGKAAVKVLEAAGFEVTLPQGRKCCGRPAFSQGNLEAARKLGAHNLALLNQDSDSAPILFLEPSCYSMFAEDYRELGLAGFETVARRCFLFERFVEDLLTKEPESLPFKPKAGRVIIHSHCHVKAMMSPAFLKALAGRLPEREVTLLDTGCCGMAGAFGATADKYELSLKLAEPLIQQVRGQPYGTIVVASGTSCRHQISHLAPVRPRHMAEVLADALG
jgi:FAD/FMN-containing dehydrogenase/Fe-S oxidoreductase